MKVIYHAGLNAAVFPSDCSLIEYDTNQVPSVEDYSNAADDPRFRVEDLRVILDWSEALASAAQDVVSAWQNGNLAEAVRHLAFVLEDYQA